jgi:hypothetical protein
MLSPVKAANVAATTRGIRTDAALLQALRCAYRWGRHAGRLVPVGVIPRPRNSSCAEL